MTAISPGHYVPRASNYDVNIWKRQNCSPSVDFTREVGDPAERDSVRKHTQCALSFFSLEADKHAKLFCHFRFATSPLTDGASPSLHAGCMLPAKEAKNNQLYRYQGEQP